MPREDAMEPIRISMRAQTAADEIVTVELFYS